MVAVGSLVNLVVTYGTQMWGFLHFGQFPLTSPSAHGRRVQAVSMTPGCLRQMPGRRRTFDRLLLLVRLVQVYSDCACNHLEISQKEGCSPKYKS